MKSAVLILALMLSSICVGCAARGSVGDRKPAQPLTMQTKEHVELPDATIRQVSYDPPPIPTFAPDGFACPPPAEELPLSDAGSLPLTRLDLEGIAFQNNPTLAAAAARMVRARGRRVQAGLYPNPVIGYHATEVGERGAAGAQGAFVAQRLIMGGKRRLDQAIADGDFDVAHFQFHAQERRVLSDVRTRFYEALVAQRRVELTGELARISDNLVTATETLQRGGLATENDVLQATIRADETHILVDNALNEEIESWRRLAAVIGTPLMNRAALDGELTSDQPAWEWEECREKVLTGNPSLMAARARVARASVGVARARREPIPDIDLFVSVRHANVASDDIANVQVGIPIPVFDRNQGNIRSAQAEWQEARSEVRRIATLLQDRLATAYRKYANARQQATRYQGRIVPRAKKSLELVTQGYSKGQVEYLTLLTAQQTFIQVNLAYLDALREFRASSSVIEGQLLSGSLSTPVEFQD